MSVCFARTSPPKPLPIPFNPWVQTAAHTLGEVGKDCPEPEPGLAGPLLRPEGSMNEQALGEAGGAAGRKTGPYLPELDS